MAIIYEPKGKAREYSPLALNIYSGCDHDCKYCYIKTMPHVNASNIPEPKTNIVKNLEKELRKTQLTKQVLLSFIGDPYCKAEMEYRITKQILEILNGHNVPVAILTKGGARCLRDIDLLKRFKNIKVGATLTFDNSKDSLMWEPGASAPKERIETLKILHENNIKTWASFEPVIKPEQSLSLIKATLPFIDEYKLGKWNHDSLSDKIEWADYVKKAVLILRTNNKQFYVKEDLRKYAHGLTAQESDMDFISLKTNKIIEEQFCLF